MRTRRQRLSPAFRSRVLCAGGLLTLLALPAHSGEPPFDNNGFETGLVMWGIGFTSLATTVEMTQINGLPPTEGLRMSLQVAGQMSPMQAATYTGLTPALLQSYYESIGGAGSIGNYSVLRRNFPAGTYSFDWTTDDGDVENPDFLDHVFYIVGGVIHPLTDGLQPQAAVWRTETFTTTGGFIYFVSANGGDTALGINLYTDNFRFATIVPACPGDADGDQLVGLSDIAVVIQNWGAPSATLGDLDADGVVGLSDISVVNMNWNADCSGGKS